MSNAEGRVNSADRRWIALIVLLAYAAVVISVTLRHEPWSDEAEPWLLARDGGLQDLYRVTPHVGMPALWFLLLMPLAKAGLPLVSMGLLNSALAIAAIALLLLKSPFPLVFRLAFTFGFFAVFEYGVLARPYALMMLMMFAIAVVYPRRAEYPIVYGLLIALLANVVPHMVAIAGMLTLLWAWEIKRLDSLRFRGIVSLIIMVTGELLLLWQVRPPADSQLPGYAILRSPDSWIQTATYLFYYPRRHLLFFGELSRLIAPLTLLAILVGVLDRPKLLAFLVGSLGWLMYVYHFKWFMPPRHSGVVLLLFVMTLWLAMRESSPSAGGPLLRRLSTLGRRAATALLTMGLALSIWPAGEWCIADWRRQFSEASAMGEWLHENTESGQVIMVDRFGAPVIAHLPADRRIWLAARREFGTFHTWTGTAVRRYDELMYNIDEMIDQADEFFPAPQPILVLSSVELHAERFQLLFKTPGRRIGYYPEAEQYFLYGRRPGVGAPASSPASPSRESWPVPSS